MWRNGVGYANHIGDDTVACAWNKYLERRDDVEWVEIYGPNDDSTWHADCVIHFHHQLKGDAPCKMFYYLQNAWPRNEHWPNGTIGVFNDHKERFDGYLFASDGLRAASGENGAVVPFAVDRERFYAHGPDDRYSGRIIFVGNDIRGESADAKYLAPAVDHGLQLYGGPRTNPAYEAIRKGRLSEEELPKVYSSAINLNYSIPIAAEYGMMNMRVYEVAACKGKLLSDTMPQGFESDGRHGNPLPFVYPFSSLSPATIEHNYREVLAHHTWEHRMEALMRHLKEVL